ncbi:FAD/FMN-dependent dehydrogenase [Frankia casuarinae]|nr:MULTISPECIES: D-arabinono-1,4-lactone oxidase [Frankia]EYT92976.1 FAD/FMN-dependent dehydrogenase [Frankia casuarinae]KDA43319.1 FAD/FMN-dependent dehydrogenase [Frankia sp. BMG5.23]TFE30309.1 FAD-binding protein [Frankia sp. B2]
MGSPVGKSSAWRNWAGNETVRSVRLARPRDAEEISALVGTAIRDGHQIRAIGSSHSMSAIGRPDPGSVQVRLDRCADLVALDGGSGLVTVRGGMTMRRLNRLLAEAGLALTNQGDVDEVTIAGAISTGTHGTGSRFGGLCTQVRALEVVLGDGSVVTCSRGERPELFAAARLGLGAVGVVTSVTLQAVPLFALQVQEGPMRLDEVLDTYDDLVDQTDHLRFSWFPHTTTALVRRGQRRPLDDGLAPLPRLRCWVDDELVSNTLFGALMTTGRRMPAAVRPIAHVSARASGSRTFRDLSYRVFTSHRRVRFKEMEYALPRADLAATLRELVYAMGSADVRAVFPVEVRCAAADEIPISTAYGRDTAYIAVHVDHRGAHGDYFGLAEKIMLSVGGRPHWGKLHSLDAATLRGLYPRFDDFLAVRDAADPTGVFANAYLDRVLGSPACATNAR